MRKKNEKFAQKLDDDREKSCDPTNNPIQLPSSSKAVSTYYFTLALTTHRND